MKRDLYAEVSARIVAELEAGAAPWVKPWSATPGANTPCNAVSNRPYSGCNVVLLWMAQAAGYRTPRFLTFKQALELGGNVRKGERGTKVYFVKQLQVRDQGADDSSSMRVIPMMREYKNAFFADHADKVRNIGKNARGICAATGGGQDAATAAQNVFCRLRAIKGDGQREASELLFVRQSAFSADKPRSRAAASLFRSRNPQGA
jgi:N-terminal domain of anti-restriction factor ArdC